MPETRSVVLSFEVQTDLPLEMLKSSDRIYSVLRNGKDAKLMGQGRGYSGGNIVNLQVRQGTLLDNAKPKPKPKSKAKPVAQPTVQVQAATVVVGSATDPATAPVVPEGPTLAEIPGTMPAVTLTKKGKRGPGRPKNKK